MKISKQLNRFNILVVISIILINYFIALMMLKDFKIINYNYYLRLIFPTILLIICIFIIYKIIRLTLHQNVKLKKYYLIYIVFVTLILIINLIYAIKFPTIQFDTWQLFDTSKYTLSDFGKMNMIRQHIYNSPYQIAFPPLFPILIALLNSIFDFGVFAFIVINSIISFLLLYYILKIGAQLNHFLVSLMIGSIVIFNPEMLNCIKGGSTIPFNVLVFTISSYLLNSNINNFKITHIISLSLLSGLGVLNRFDYIPIAFSLGLFVYFLVSSNRLKYIFVYYVILLSLLSPWIIYSEIHFNSFFITDNGRRLINIPDTRPSTFFTADNRALTIFDNPKLWLKISIDRWTKSVLSLNNFVTQYTYIKDLLASYVLLIVLLKIKNKKIFGLRFIFESLRRNKVVYIILSLSLLQLFAIIITGYDDSRYYILFTFLIFYLLLIILSKYLSKLSKKAIKIVIITLTLIISLDILKPGAEYARLNLERTIKLLSVDSSTTCTLKLCVNTKIGNYLDSVSNSRMIINRSETTMDIAKFSALSGEVVILSPTNLNENNVVNFVEYFDLNYLYSSDDDLVRIFEKKMEVIPTDIIYLFKLDLLSDDHDFDVRY